MTVRPEYDEGEGGTEAATCSEDATDARGASGTRTIPITVRAPGNRSETVPVRQLTVPRDTTQGRSAVYGSSSR